MVKPDIRKMDTHEGVTYGDWYEQNLAEIGADQSNHQVNPPMKEKKEDVKRKQEKARKGVRGTIRQYL